MTSTFLLISVSTWLICWLTSLVPSTASRVTSEYFAGLALGVGRDGADPAVVGLRGREADRDRLALAVSLSGPPAGRRSRPSSRRRRRHSLLLVQRGEHGARAECARADEEAAATDVGGCLLTCRFLRSGGACDEWRRSRLDRVGLVCAAAVTGRQPRGAVDRCARCGLPGGPALQQHGGDDDQALGDVLDLGRQVVEDEDVRDRREDEDAEDRADQRAAAAA